MSTNELIRKLPDAYDKRPESNNYKLLGLSEAGLNELHDDIATVLLATDIANSSGKTLDLFGEMLGKKRGSLDDDKYKYLLLTQIGQNTISGDFNSVLNAFIAMFSLSPGDVTYEDISIEESETSGNIKVIKLPLKILNRAGFSTQQSIDLIRSVLPIGVGVESANFEGTFEFAETDTEYDETAGFGSLTDESIGGYFGALIEY